MHEHVARGDDGQAGEAGDAAHDVDERVVAGTVQQLDRDGRAFLEPGLEPHRVGEHGLEGLRRIGHQQRQAIGQAGERGRVGHLAFQVAGMGEVLAFRRTPPRHRDPVREVAVAAPRLRQQHEARMRRAGVVGQREAHLAADDQMQPAALGLGMGAHDAGDRAFVGDGERAVAEGMRPLDQFLGVRRAGEEAEVAAAVEFGVGGEHGSEPDRRSGWRPDG